MRDELVALGYIIPAPNHTSAGDVAAARAVHYACWDYLGKPWAADVCPKLDRSAEPQ